MSSKNPSPKEVVRAYLAAFFQGGPDVEAVRALLTDDFTFQGPLMTAGSADDFIAQLTGMSQSMAGLQVEIHHVIADGDADGDTVAALYDFVTPMGNMPFAEWYWVRGDRISAIKLHYDPRPMLGG